MINLEYLTEQVKLITAKAAKNLKKESMTFSRDKVEEKKSHDYVSYVDKESERFLVKELSALLPEAGFITEEGSATYNGESYCWIIDPLDGTSNFIHNSAPFAVSIALKGKEGMLIGVVYEVCRDECFWTYKGAKSYLNETPIHVSNISDVDKAFVELGLPYNSESYKPYADGLIKKLYGVASGIRILGSAASELCYLAAGRFEARIEADLGIWDIAAGSLILQNAGGKITNFAGEEDSDCAISSLASNGEMHSYFLELLSKIKEDE